MPLRNVQPAVGVCLISFYDTPSSSKPTCGAGPLGSTLSFIPWFRPWLGIDQKYDVALEELLNTPNPSYADISIVVHFDAWYFPVRRKTEFRFETKKLNDGKNHWFARPVVP